jgi:hypothetical protein
MVERGDLDREQVYRELRERGLSPVQTIYVASRVLGISRSEAKTAIYQSSAWRDQHASWQQIQSALVDGSNDS